MRKINRRVVSAFLTIAIVMSMFSYTLSAGATSVAGKYKVYTSLGDSNAAGYATTGYIDNRLPAPEAYKTKVANALQAELRDFGTGGYRTNEIRYMIDPDYAMDWSYAEICQGQVHKSQLDEYKDDYIKAVEDADILTILIGSNDFFGDTFGTAFAQLYMPVEKLEEIKAKVDGETDFGAKVLTVIDELDSIVKVINFVTTLLSLLSDKVDEFQENWDAIIERIYEMNPDVQIVAISPINSFNNTKLSEDSTVDFVAFFFDMIIARFQNYIRFLSPYAKTYYYCDITDIKLGKLALNDPDIMSKYLPLVHHTDEGHTEIANRVVELLETEGKSQSKKISPAAMLALAWEAID